MSDKQMINVQVNKLSSPLYFLCRVSEKWGLQSEVRQVYTGWSKQIIAELQWSCNKSVHALLRTFGKKVENSISCCCAVGLLLKKVNFPILSTNKNMMSQEWRNIQQEQSYLISLCRCHGVFVCNYHSVVPQSTHSGINHTCPPTPFLS